MALLEQLRREAYTADSAPFWSVSVERVPTDIVIWSRGEPEQPEHRAVTKIGGLPYRPTGKPWPVAAAGQPLTFLAQFCFTDSRDLVPALPGDILLIFAKGRAYGGRQDDYDFAFGESDLFAFEWVSLGDAPLVSQAEAPDTGWSFLPCYGTLCRTWDYPSVAEFGYPEIAEDIPGICEATKIGGAAPWMDSEDFTWLDRETETPGRYLCTLCSVFGDHHEPYPFLNVSDPIPYEEWRRMRPLMIADVGLFNLYLTSDGTVGWTGRCQS